MKRNKLFITAALAVFLTGLLTGFLRAEADNKDDDQFSGSFMVGYRMVDTSGTETKYMEDINLEKGPRLFEFKLHFAPQGDLKKLFDRMDLRAYNFGGDPYETLGLEVEKYGKYKFQYDRRKSTYFYHDNLNSEDLHTFNFDRINDSGMLKVWLGNKSHAYLDFNRYTKKGSSTTSFDFNRVEFEFDRPIDEESMEIAMGLDYSSKVFSFALEEKIQDYNNANSMFLPGYADGGAFSNYPSALYLFHLDQPYDMKGYTHSAKFTAAPFKNFLLRGSLKLIKQDTDITYYEDAWGVDLYGDDFSYLNGGSGNFTRKIQLYDVDFSYLLSAKLAIVGGVRYQNFDQTGSLTANGETTPVNWQYESGGVEGGIQYQPSAKIGITLGYRFERRDIEDEVEIAKVNGPTDRTGFFGTLNWKPSKAFGLTADYQNGTYDNPFTLTSPTDYNRFRLTLKYALKTFYASGSYLYNESKNDQIAGLWKATKNQLNLRLGFHGQKVKMSAGYALIDVKRDGNHDIAYPPPWTGGEGSYLWDVTFEGKSNLFDAYLYFNLDKSWGIGGYANLYSNKGSWELSRTTLKAFLKYECRGGFITQLGYRFVDFNEKELGLNDYKANIFEISFGYQW
jgi:hypothetical protein